ncbi:MAG: hypothetical protein P4L53_26845 [Candidatus Obscuribacterales bacterium]|nr:hypothetical protein [Candidatus Obscuribacterales bacterium]
MNNIQKVSLKSNVASAVVVTFTLMVQSTTYSAVNADTPPPLLTPVEKAKVQYLLKQMSTHLHASPLDYEVGRDNLAAGTEPNEGAKSELPTAKSAYVELRAMGKKILPELILGLSNHVPFPFPAAVVESLIFELEGQPMVIEFIANGKVQSTGFKAVENMLEYDDWRRTWLLPLFSSNLDAARELAYTALPKKYRYCWEEWETHDKTQPMLELHLKAASEEKSSRLRRLAVSALGTIHQIIESSEDDASFSLQLSAFIEEVEGTRTPGKTIGDAGKEVSAWREKRKPKREEQKTLLARALCDMLEHDPDAGIRQECAKQLRNCKESFVEESIIDSAKDADQQVRDECAVFLMKRAWDANNNNI